MIDRTCSNCAECEVITIRTKYTEFTQYICSIEGNDMNPSDCCPLHITEDEVSEEYTQ